MSGSINQEHAGLPGEITEQDQYPLWTRKTRGTLYASDCSDVEPFQCGVILFSMVRGIMTIKCEFGKKFQAFLALDSARSPGWCAQFYCSSLVLLTSVLQGDLHVEKV